MRTNHLLCLFLTVVFAVGLVLSGCSGSADILKEVSGQWENTQDNATIEINLAGDAKSIKVGEQAYSVNVDKILMDKYQVNLKVKNGSGQPELWTLRQIWDDNGSSFKLAFEKSGQKKMLLPKG
ncbi:hypothetical protein [Desulfatitalea tepidiphila]|uniref:hypothetical protein n=1 Tax=Desulfatitalea tepidiphila TaxID=1185843 RepID=UPI0006B4BC56|nr:hypothetical protein [Desulfatitalea tepidiphila]